jgi:hypothetical protein
MSCEQQSGFETILFGAPAQNGPGHRAGDGLSYRDSTCRHSRCEARSGSGRQRPLKLGADKKILLALAVSGWLASRGRNDALQRAGDHALLVTTAASLLPHALKAVFDRGRSDRRTRQPSGSPGAARRQRAGGPKRARPYAARGQTERHRRACTMVLAHRASPDSRSERFLSGSRDPRPAMRSTAQGRT